MDDWEGAFEDDLSQKRPVDDQVQKSLKFVQDHESNLMTMEQTTKAAVATSMESHHRPIRLVMDSTEKVFPQDLISIPGNDLLKKVVTVLAFDCDEIHELKEIAETKLYGPLIMFGQAAPELEEGVEPAPLQTGDREKMLGKFLPILQEISNFIDRCYAVCSNIVQQLSSLMKAREQLYKTTFQPTHLFSIFNSLGEILSVLITLDCIITQNEMLQESWSYYKAMISYARADPVSFGIDEAGVTRFERLLVSVDQSVIIGEIFKGCVEQNFESTMEGDEETLVPVRSSQIFMSELLYCLRVQLENCMTAIGTSAEMFERAEFLNGMALYALYRRLLPANIPPDGKLHKTLWSMQKAVPMVILCERVVWNTGEFLLTYAPYDIKKPDPPNPATYRRTFLQNFDATLSQKATLLASQAAAWMVLAESRLQPTTRHDSNIRQVLDVRGSILLKGLALAIRANYLAKSCLVMHASMAVPMNRANLTDIAILVENLKAMELTFTRKRSVVTEVHVHMMRVLVEGIMEIVQPMQLRMDAGGGGKKLDPLRVDLLSALNTLEALVKGSSTFSYARQMTLSVLGEIVASSKLTVEREGPRLRSYIKRLMALSTLVKDVETVCDTKFLYFHLHILAPIFDAIYVLPSEAHRIQYIVSAFCDGIRSCQMVSHVDATPFFINYRNFLRKVVKSSLIEPLCRDIETDLRLHIHTKHLDHMQALNPKTDTLRPLRPFLELSPIRILGTVLHIRSEVTHYLDTAFYNLTTIALHDWRTYSDMRSLAAEKLGLTLMDNFLPMGSLDQGLDVLQIMRNIHIFVSRFSYNLNMQQFIEFRPDKSSKHLNTIKIQSIAASIRQHGLGVLNTTVNFTYQFLAQKFHIFSQFLFDDYIRAHLSREHRWFKKNKNDASINSQYPYDRALNFVRDIRKLGVTDAGKTFLDQFRVLITEIGNALGYVRMVRSASMYYCSEAVKFLPEMDEVIHFSDHAGKGKPMEEGEGEGGFVPDSGANYAEETVRAGRNLDDVISTLVANFSAGNDYFKVLVKVFQSVLLTNEHDHLRNFYMIVPSLCISWVDASLLAKDAMYKTVRGVTKEMYFTDDGFAMGLAYCLAILKQTKKNESLHWVDTVRHKYKTDMKQLEAQQAKRAAKEAKMKEQREKEEKKNRSFFGFGTSKKVEEVEEDHEDYEEVHTLQMTGKRLEAQRRETDQLFYAMSGAGIFFKRTDVDT